MRPKNSPERTSAFIRFVVFYVITTALIVAAVFFGLQIPFKENRQLQSQLDAVYKERDFDREFFNVMRETKSLIDTIERAGPNADRIEGGITERIQKMDAMLNADSVSRKKLYGLIVETFTDAKNDKKALKASSSKDETVAVLNKKYNDLLQNRDEWIKEYDRLKAQILQSRQ